MVPSADKNTIKTPGQTPKHHAHQPNEITNGLPFRGSVSERVSHAEHRQPASFQEFVEDNDLDPIEMADEPTGKKGKTSDKNPGDGGKDRWDKRFIALVKQHPQISMGVAALILVLIGGSVAYAMTRPGKVDNTQLSKVAPKPKPVPPAPPTSPLTGMEVSADDAKRPVTGVMIENTVFARPQSGLKEAGVVYEAIAEAGITRFLALYQEAKPGNIGPVRSARPYYVDWAHSFDAAYGHVGGSPDALAKIKSDGVKDLDQFFNSAYYHRIFHAEQKTEGKVFPGVLAPIALFEIPCGENLRQTLERFPFFKSTPMEQRMMFANPAINRLTPLSIVPTAKYLREAA